MPEQQPYNQLATGIIHEQLLSNSYLWREYGRLQGIDDLRGFVRGLIYGTVTIRDTEDAIRSLRAALATFSPNVIGILSHIDWEEL